jgi:hypothetical protein
MATTPHLQDVLANLCRGRVARPLRPSDDVPLRELEALATLLEGRRDELGRFASVFREAACAGRTGGDPHWARWHPGDAVSRGGDELAEQIADAEVPFWQQVRHAVALGSGDD